jgi:hypothetical protein
MKPSAKSIGIRTAGFLLVAAGAALLLARPLQQERLERRIRTLLLEVQEGLQRYHVKEEIYPKRAMSGADLIALLVSGNHLASAPSNPWTQVAYGREGEDRLRYRTDGAAETYELTVLDSDGETILFRLDSTHNQSIE